MTTAFLSARRISLFLRRENKIMAEILDVDRIYKKLKKQIKQDIAEAGSLSLASLRVGNDYSAKVYSVSQEKLAQEFGVKYVSAVVDENVTIAECIEKIKAFSRDKNISGIIVNKPFPKDWNEADVFGAVDPAKDIEGLHPLNLGSLFWGDESKFISPTVLSVLEVLDSAEVELYGKEVTIVGFSTLIGKPLAIILGRKFATVNITHIATYESERLPFYLENADIVISAVGKPHIIRGECLKKGAIIIDVGIGQKNGKICGDVEFESARKRASLITPVPGGIGRLTPLFLFQNLVKTASRQK